MSWGLLKGFGQGLSSSGQFLFNAALQEEKQRWQEEYRQRVTQEERAYKDKVRAEENAREDQLLADEIDRASQAKAAEIAREDARRAQDRGWEVEDSKPAPGSLTESDQERIEGIDLKVNVLRERLEGVTFGDEAEPIMAEIDELMQRRNNIIDRANARTGAIEEPPEVGGERVGEDSGLNRADVLADARRQYPNMGDAELNRMVDAFMRDNGAQTAGKDSKTSPPPSQPTVSSGPPEWLIRAREGNASQPASANPVAALSDAPTAEPRYGAGLDTIVGTPARAVGGLLSRFHSASASDSEQRSALETVRSAMRMNRPVSKDVLQKALLVATGEERNQIMAMLAE